MTKNNNDNSKNDSKNEKKASTIAKVIGAAIQLAFMSLVGIFVLLVVVGINEVSPDYLKDKDIDDLADLKLSAEIQEYGKFCAITLIVLLPVITTGLFYYICGFKYTVIINIIIGLSSTWWQKYYFGDRKLKKK